MAEDSEGTRAAQAQQRKAVAEKALREYGPGRPEEVRHCRTDRGRVIFHFITVKEKG